MICAAVVTAQFVGGKATRDALYLANLEVTSLPMMIIATAVFSIAMVALASKLLGSVSPATFVPLAFVSSAVLLLLGWVLAYAAPAISPKRRLAVRGSKHSVTISQKPDPSSGPMPEICR